MVTDASRSLRSSPLTVPLAGALLLSFLALVVGGWFGQLGYLLAAGALFAVAGGTWARFDRPGNWAAASAVLGLAATAVFAATELSDLGRESDGGPVIIPVAWLFAATAWYTHWRGAKTIRWVITLVQVSFTSLSALLFIVAAARAVDGLQAVGYLVAGLGGALAGALAVTGIIGRIRIELAKR